MPKIAAARVRDEELLHRWKPKLCYDSLEAFFADDPAQMVVNPGNTLRRGGAGGKVIAARRVIPGAPQLWWEGDGAPPSGKTALTLDWPTYSDTTTKGEAGDRLSIAGRDYRTQYVALRKARPDLCNKIVARAVRDPDTGQLWLQYWLWYFYNDYQLAFDVGLHEGDWEMIQLGLENDVPVVAVYAQHDVAERRPWDMVEKAANGETPLVFPGRGSHASYYEAGLFETGAWFDVTDGKRSPKQTDLIIIGDDLPGWIRWEGMWGDTEPQIRGLHTPSPKGPIKHRLQWSHPQQWANTAAERRTPGTPPDAPHAQVARADDYVVLNFDFTRLAEQAPAVIVVNVNSSEVVGEPPRAFTFNVEDRLAARIVTSIALVPGRDYVVCIAATSRQGIPSAPLVRFLPARNRREDAPSDAPGSLRLTPGVQAAVTRLPESTTASRIAAELLKLHPDFAGRRGGKVQLDVAPGPTAATEEWLRRVRVMITDESVRLHGRVVILGLARLDDALRQQLAEAGLLTALEAEIEESVNALFGDVPATPNAAAMRPAAADIPALVDLLGFTPLVSGLRAVLDDKDTRLPLAVAVTGKWGAGKSSIMRQLAEQLSMPPDGVGRHRRWTIVRFDAWKYEHSERLWAALAKSVYDQAVEQRRGWFGRVRFRTSLERRRLGWWRFLLRFAWPVLAAAAAVAVLTAANLSERGETAGVLGLVAAAVGGATHYWRAIADPFKRAVERHASHPDYAEHLGFTSEADRDIECLTRTVAPTERDALAVFVDDLDRCNSAHLVEVVEAINQIFNSDERQRSRGHRCVFVLGLDREMVAGSIEAAYGDTVDRLAKAGSPIAEDFGFHFIDKIVQLSVGVPRPRLDSLPALLTGVATRRAAREGAADKLLQEARHSEHVDTAELAALSHLELNPRQAKRFHNVFRLQVYVAAADGVDFTEDQLLALARWVALRLRWPALADDLDHEPGLLWALDAAANEEKTGATDSSPEEIRLRALYKRWFSDGSVTGVLLVSREGADRRVSQLPLESFLTVA